MRSCSDGIGRCYHTRRAGRGETYLAGDGERVCAVDTLDDASDVLDRVHQRGEFVVFEVCQAWDDAGGYDEDI